MCVASNIDDTAQWRGPPLCEVPGQPTLLSASLRHWRDLEADREYSSLQPVVIRAISEHAKTEGKANFSLQ
jgi:hypothetical protein